MADQVEISVDYQIVRGKGRYDGQLNLTRSAQPQVGQIVVLDEGQAEAVARFFADAQAQQVRRQAESTKDSDTYSGPPIPVFAAKFVSS
jgi:hypothetical protein